MKRVSVILALSFILCCFQNQVVADQKITIRVMDFPPNYYKDINGYWVGLGVDLSSAIVKKAGFKPVFDSQPWARALQSMKDGSLHYITNIKKTDERSRFLNWIGPVRQGEVGLIVKKGNENLPIKTLNDFITVAKNIKSNFGYQIGFTYTEEFHKRLENDPEFKRSFEATAKGELNFRKVLAERIIGFFETTISAAYRIKNDPNYKELAIHPLVLRKTPVYHGVSKKGVDDETFNKLHEAFEMFKKNGELQPIVGKYP